MGFVMELARRVVVGVVDLDMRVVVWELTATVSSSPMLIVACHHLQDTHVRLHTELYSHTVHLPAG